MCLLFLLLDIVFLSIRSRVFVKILPLFTKRLLRISITRRRWNDMLLIVINVIVTSGITTLLIGIRPTIIIPPTIFSSRILPLTTYLLFSSLLPIISVSSILVSTIPSLIITTLIIITLIVITIPLVIITAVLTVTLLRRRGVFISILRFSWTKLVLLIILALGRSFFPVTFLRLFTLLWLLALILFPLPLIFKGRFSLLILLTGIWLILALLIPRRFILLLILSLIIGPFLVFMWRSILLKLSALIIWYSILIFVRWVTFLVLFTFVWCFPLKILLGIIWSLLSILILLNFTIFFTWRNTLFVLSACIWLKFFLTRLIPWRTYCIFWLYLGGLWLGLFLGNSFIRWWILVIWPKLALLGLLWLLGFPWVRIHFRIWLDLTIVWIYILKFILHCLFLLVIRTIGILLIFALVLLSTPSSSPTSPWVLLLAATSAPPPSPTSWGIPHWIPFLYLLLSRFLWGIWSRFRLNDYLRRVRFNRLYGGLLLLLLLLLLLYSGLGRCLWWHLLCWLLSCLLRENLWLRLRLRLHLGAHGGLHRSSILLPRNWHRIWSLLHTMCYSVANKLL